MKKNNKEKCLLRADTWTNNLGNVNKQTLNGRVATSQEACNKLYGC